MKKTNPKISVHQINTVTGDIKGNYEKILEGIKRDIEDEVEISVFPETAISGYMCGALWDNEDFVDEQREIIHRLRTFVDKNYNGTVILGFIDQDGRRANGYPRLFNSAALISKSFSSGFKIYRKRILASTDHHEDKKYFITGSAYQGHDDNDMVFTLDLPKSGKIRVGVPICEDMWYTSHERNLPREMVKKYGADLIININQSYFHYGKEELRFKLISNFAKKYNTPVVYCNSVGVGDIVKNIVIFDGGSMAVNEEGNCIARLPRFCENRSLILPGQKEKKIVFAEKYAEIFRALAFEQKEFFRLSGLTTAQVHLSGGLDSAITAAIVTWAMGKNNTYFITNPSDLNTKSFKYVKHLSEKLDVPFETNPIQSIYDEFIKVDKESFGDELSDTAKASVQAVLRTVQGIAASHRFGSGIVATGNHTEIVLGWASFHDIGSIGVHAIIGDMTKMELYEFADYINWMVYGKEVIPQDIYNGTFKPSAELPDAPGEDPIDYSIYSGICAELIRGRKTVEDIASLWSAIALYLEGKEHVITDVAEIEDIFPDFNEVVKYSYQEFRAHVIRAEQLMKRSVYKAAQGAPIVIISPRSRGFSNRETLINKYESIR